MDLVYLLRSGLGLPDYWHPCLEIQTDFLTGKIGRYPISMNAKASYPGVLNEEGVPVVFLSGKGQVLPVTVALYGLGSHEAYISTGDQRYYSQMKCALRWLENHGASLGDGLGWPNEQDFPVFHLRAPWFSGLVQGLALSFFIRAYQLDQTETWYVLAHKSWLGYHVSIDGGGFRRDTEVGVLYEEYPGPELDCTFNGICHALIGLWEAYRSGLIPEACADFELGLAGLRACLPRFAHGCWSLYSLNRCAGRPLLASPYYQRANGLLAQVIGLMTGDAEFCLYGESWQRNSESVVRRIGLSMRVAWDRFFYAPELLHSDKARKDLA